mmetsp:Transcript_45896/g.69235  ORF Transcript_45896/g.69235 Transcript_45896/m.69235 type:complete len:90 (-) Transcript_45896:318-587(-)
MPTPADDCVPTKPRKSAPPLRPSDVAEEAELPGAGAAIRYIPAQPFERTQQTANARHSLTHQIGIQPPGSVFRCVSDHSARGCAGSNPK